MRVAVLLFPLLLLAACKDEPRFEERYNKAAKDIEARAKAMDANIANSDAAAASEGLQPAAKPSNAPPSSGE